jgi:hypothetical protein
LEGVAALHRAHGGGGGAVYSAQYPAFARTIGLEVEVQNGAEVLATTTLPWPASDPTKFASIHSNPPWQPTTRPEIVVNLFGNGKAIYCASTIENIDALFDALPGLVSRLYKSFSFEVDAPSCVEATLFHLRTAIPGGGQSRFRDPSSVQKLRTGKGSQRSRGRRRWRLSSSPRSRRSC